MRSDDASDAAIIHLRDTVSIFEDARVMGHDHQCPVTIHCYRFEQLNDTAAGLMIKRTGGFIADDQSGIVHQRAGNSDPLLLTRRKAGPAGRRRARPSRLFPAIQPPC